MNAVHPPLNGRPDWAPLVDVSAMSMSDLLASDDIVLAKSVQRLVQSLDDPDGIISAFQSFTSSS